MAITVQESRWQNLSELISHIEQTHHVYTQAALVHIAELFNHQELAAASAEIRGCFEKLEADLTPHLMKEERILFPYIVELEGNPEQAPVSCFGSVANPIRMMDMEHQSVKKLLEELRELTANYRPPSEGNVNISALYTALAELDRDLLQHIHLESDVLFPQAMKLESHTAT